MEDGVTEVQSFLPPQNVDSEDGSKREEKNDEKEEGFVPEAEKSVEEDLGTEHSGKNFAAKDEAKNSDSGGGGGGGLINNLISSFITPSSPRTEEGGAVGDGDGGERGGVDNGGEGGIISNLVSNFFHRSDGEEDVVESEKEKEEEEILVDGKIKRQKTQDFEDANGGGGGGIIHNLVSHLPASLPDDAVPTADEAIILINALVRD
ncbi:uncharacterized protein LOC130732254 [Lotus japonicus]|uniref:uncharacterized protein LOC130732254 n=1 Tax=Lotus japonicus TaxID=34305 RepID=UPI00258C1B78|nr:uncharacterized protein LOC130732254 [Lotus japonicus]